MKRLYTIIFAAMAAILLTVVACDKSDPVKPVEPIEEEDSAEEIVLAVQNTYLLESFEEKDGYVLTFHNPSPIKLKKDYPDGIKSVTLQKGAVKEVTKAPSDVTLTFTDGKSAKLAFYAWIDAELDSEFVSFGEEGEPQSVAYTINGSVPESADVTVSVKGAEGVATYEITPDESGKGGLVTFSLTGSGYFSKEVQVVLSNGEKSVTLPLTLVREEFNFEDGSVVKKLELNELPRWFGFVLSKQDKSVTVTLPDDADWVKTEMQTNGTSAPTSINIWIEKNSGNKERHTTITLNKENSDRCLTIEISQIGAKMEGSIEHALVSLYEALDGDNWEGTIWDSATQKERPANENWCSDKPIWEWAGMSCGTRALGTSEGEDGYLIDLDNEGTWWLNLTEVTSGGPYEVPDAFWKIVPCFSHLQLGGNNLKGNIPDELWNVNFWELDLGHNPGLEGTLGDGLYNMTDLHRFSINGTKVKGTLSSNIGKLTNLWTFDIGDCEFEGTIPEEFGNLSLMYCNFERNYFSQVPQFVRYRSTNSSYGWILGKGCPQDYSWWQKNKNGQNVFLPFPYWAHVKYGCSDWGCYWDDEAKAPEFPYADDLQYPATEYYWDGQNWRHPNLEYPAREYWFDGKEWIHDASCPWDQEYIDPRGKVMER